MRAANDERRPGGGGEASSWLASHDESTTQRGQKSRAQPEPLQVWAHGYLVVGWRGLCRMVLVVTACPYCRRPHSHTGKPDFLSGRRTASCHQGRYLVHVGTVEGEVAA